MEQTQEKTPTFRPYADEFLRYMQYGLEWLDIIEAWERYNLADDLIEDSNLNWLMCLAYAGEARAVDIIVNQISGEDLAECSTEGNSALHFAARKGHIPVIKLLHEREDWLLKRFNSKGQTPLMEAIEYGHLAAADYIMALSLSYQDAFLRYGRVSKPEGINAKIFESVKRLADMGFDLNKKSSSKDTLLQMLCSMRREDEMAEAFTRNQSDCIEYLISHGAQADPICLYRAVHENNIDLIQLLLRHGASPYEKATDLLTTAYVDLSVCDWLENIKDLAFLYDIDYQQMIALFNQQELDSMVSQSAGVTANLAIL